MKMVLAGVPNVSFYFDNIFVYSSDWPIHGSALRSVLECLQSNGITVKPSKCHFGVGSISYLGYVMPPDYLWPQTDKISYIVFMTPPSPKKVVSEFSGSDIFLQEFITHSSELTGSLCDLKKPVRESLYWSDDSHSRYEQCNRRCPPCLSYVCFGAMP